MPITMQITTPMIAELDQEARTTRRVLERVPADKLAWKPHEKSMSLGQLALHVAQTPGAIADIATPDVFPFPESFTQPSPASASEIMPAFEASVAKAKAFLSGLEDHAATAMWRAKRGETVMWEVPRIGLLRALMFNHWYHHRGQLSVYLRLLGVPVPSIYGPSADEPM
jgi:uncharacterized damage-inducible protein DinB